MTTDVSTQRVLSDIQSKLASLDHRALRALEGTSGPSRDGNLVVRLALAHLRSRTEKRSVISAAEEYWPHDFQLQKAASGPAMTDQGGWAAELVPIVVADLADRLLVLMEILRRQFGIE
jgi:hypothetical protein